MKTAMQRPPANTETANLRLTPIQRRILYQVMHHVQDSSHYGFGDVYWVAGPSIDILALELGKLPHQIIADVNVLIQLDCVGVVHQEDEPIHSNIVCMNCEGWRQHPNFKKLLPWIAAGEQLQDWESEPEFEGMSLSEIDSSLAEDIDMSGWSLSAVQDVIREPQGENVVVRPNYVLRPTGHRLMRLAEQVSRRSNVACVVPNVGMLRFTTVAQLLRDLGSFGDVRLNARVARPLEGPLGQTVSHHGIEAAYLESGRLYFVLDYYGECSIS